MMKKSILIISLSLVFAISGLIPVIAQEQPKPGKDTVNIDTDAKPEFYYSTEDENSETNGSGKSSAGTIAIIAGAVIVVGAGAFFLLKKKK
jgi:LPXTG-motif cell wall-anchored protein